MRPGRKISWVSITFVLAVLVVLAESVGGVLTSDGPGVSVTAQRLAPAPNETEVEFALHSQRLSLTEHLGVLPSNGSVGRYSAAGFFYDSSYPSPYVEAQDSGSLAELIASDLQGMYSGVPFDTLTASAVPAFLTANPTGLFAILGGVAPDAVWSDRNTSLATWVHDGGTLVWAGGPLGFGSGAPCTDGAFDYDGPGWLGQLELVGYPLTDSPDLHPRYAGPSGCPPPPGGSAPPSPPVPLLGNVLSPVGAALGIEYDGTAAGANVSQVAAHGGTVLGWTSTPVPGVAAAPRTSLAYVPVGKGGVFLFGGIDLSSYNGYLPYATGWIFQGGVKLTLDTALLIATGYRPVFGPTASSTVELAPFGSTTTTVTLRGYSGEVLSLVDSESVGVVYTYWQGDLFPGIGATGSTDP